MRIRIEVWCGFHWRKIKLTWKVINRGEYSCSLQSNEYFVEVGRERINNVFSHYENQTKLHSYTVCLYCRTCCSKLFYSQKNRWVWKMNLKNSGRLFLLFPSITTLGELKKFLNFYGGRCSFTFFFIPLLPFIFWYSLSTHYLLMATDDRISKEGFLCRPWWVLSCVLSYLSVLQNLNFKELRWGMSDFWKLNGVRYLRNFGPCIVLLSVRSSKVI